VHTGSYGLMSGDGSGQPTGQARGQDPAWPVRTLSRSRASADLETLTVNPVSHLVTATRTLMAGTATTAQVLWAVAAAGVLIAVFAPLTALLYQRK